mmetsp:Transcript_37605/g.31734  ORF Transcript_37605/g.31734 Transcript_37605/m.31734 type:complete len:156 (+) Transcript_37605:47-514(+)
MHINYKDCSKKSDIIKIEALSVSPKIPETKNPFEIDINLSPSNFNKTINISDGTIYYKIIKGWIPLSSGSSDLCSTKDFDLPLGMGTMSLGGIKCPVTSGKFVLSLKGKIIKVLFNGKINIGVKVKDPKGSELACISINVNFSNKIKIKDEILNV